MIGGHADFRRGLTTSHCVGAEWLTFAGKVAFGESFVVETVDALANGRIEIDGVRAGGSLAIHIEKIDLDIALVCALPKEVFRA